MQDAESKDILGYFYLDLHPRDGKYGHAAVFPLQPGCIGPEGKLQVSLSAMMAIFSQELRICYARSVNLGMLSAHSAMATKDN